MKNIYAKQTVDHTPKQKGGEIATDSASRACPHCTDPLNFDSFDKDYGEAGPLAGTHCHGKNYAWDAPGSTDRHGLV